MISRRDMVTFRIVPDRTVNNKRNHDLMRSIHDFHQRITKRIQWKEKNILEQMRFTWDILITSEDICFYCTIPKEKASFVRQQLELTWERAAIQEEQIAVYTDRAHA